jgi:hypothetical protein
MSSIFSKSSKSTRTDSVPSDTASTHSTVSTATTLKDIESPKKKWFSRPKTEPAYVNKSDEQYAKKAIHNEAIASYLSIR